MKSYAIGVVVAGVAAWFGVQEAHAQGISITGIGTTAVTTGTSTIQLDGTVSGYTDYFARVWVYLNGVGKHDSLTYCNSGSSLTYFIYNTQLWGMQAGDELTFRIRVWLTSTIYDMEYHYVTVQESGYYTQLQPVDGSGRTPAGGHEPLHAAVTRSDEQELLA